MSGTLPSDSRSTRPSLTHPSAQEGTIEFHWSGAVHDHTTRFIIEWMENRLDQLKSPALQKKRAVRVAVELLQNMHHHACSSSKRAEFEIRGTANGVWHLSTTNALPQEKAQALSEVWTGLKAMCLNQLRTVQREKIAKDQRSEHGGGGVGLNEILRKADGHVEMNIHHQAHESFVTFTAEIPIRS